MNTLHAINLASKLRDKYNTYVSIYQEVDAFPKGMYRKPKTDSNISLYIGGRSLEGGDSFKHFDSFSDLSVYARKLLSNEERIAEKE